MGEKMRKCAGCGELFPEYKVELDGLEGQYYCWPCFERLRLPFWREQHRRLQEEEEKRRQEEPPIDAYEYSLALPAPPEAPPRPPHVRQYYFRGEVVGEIIGGQGDRCYRTGQYSRISIPLEEFGKTFTFITHNRLASPYVRAHWIVEEIRLHSVDVGLYERYGDEEAHDSEEWVLNTYGWEKRVPTTVRKVKVKYDKDGRLCYKSYA